MYISDDIQRTVRLLDDDASPANQAGLTKMTRHGHQLKHTDMCHTRTEVICKKTKSKIKQKDTQRRRSQGTMDNMNKKRRRGDGEDT